MLTGLEAVIQLLKQQSDIDYEAKHTNGPSLLTGSDFVDRFGVERLDRNTVRTTSE